MDGISSADEYKEIRQIVRDAQRRSEGNELNFPMAGDICPSQVALVLVSRGEKIVGEFQQWGLPGFRGRQQIINARAETVTEKPMFRRSIAFQRCVIPATGFYEWDAGAALELLCSRPPLLLRTSCDGQLGFDDLA